MTTGKLTIKQQLFLQHYLGADTSLHGNATQCYLKVYECNLKAAESGGARLLQNARVKAYIKEHQKLVQVKTGVDAAWVLKESIRLYHRCMGDEAYPVEYERTDPETGIVTVETVYRRSFNPTGAKAALELIGRNAGIQAFKENIEVSHTHYLEQALARRAKAVEDRATRSIPVLPGANDVQPGRGPPASEPGHAPGRERQAGRADLIEPSGPGHADPTGRQPGGRQKEGPSTGGQPNAGQN